MDVRAKSFVDSCHSPRIAQNSLRVQIRFLRVEILFFSPLFLFLSLFLFLFLFLFLSLSLSLYLSFSLSLCLSMYHSGNDVRTEGHGSLKMPVFGRIDVVFLGV